MSDYRYLSADFSRQTMLAYAPNVTSGSAIAEGPRDEFCMCIRLRSHTVNSSQVSTYNAQQISHQMPNEIALRNGSTQTCRKGDAENKRPEKYQSVDIGNNGDYSSRSTPTLCHHILMACWQSATDLRWRLPRMCNGVVLVTTDVCEWRVQMLYLNGCLIGLFQPLTDVVNAWL